MEVKQSTNYKQFHLIKGNRTIDKGNLHRLKKSIEERDLLQYVPILVRKRAKSRKEEYEIIEGQHRFMAAKELGKPVYFIVGEGLELADVIRLNETSKRWSPKDHMESFVALGLPDYKKLEEFAKEYQFSISNAIAILSIGSNMYLQSPMSEFKAGTWHITDYDEAVAFAKMYREISQYTEEKTAKDRDLMRAVYRMYYHPKNNVRHDEFMQKLSEYPEPLYRRLNMKDYLTQFEKVLNQGTRSRAILH